MRREMKRKWHEEGGNAPLYGEGDKEVKINGRKNLLVRVTEVTERIFCSKK